MTRPEILAAIMAVAIVAPDAGDAQEAGAPDAVYLSLGYSAERGSVASVLLSVDDLMGSQSDLRVQADRDDLGYSAEALIRTGRAVSLPWINREADLSFAVRNQTSDWDAAAFATSRTGVSARLSLAQGANTALRGEYFLYQDSIYDVTTAASSLIASEAGTRKASGLGLGWSFSTVDNPFLPRKGAALDVDLKVAGLGGDARWAALAIAGASYIPVSSQGTLALRGLAGAASGETGNGLRITDRAFLAADLPRGFARHGIGPRDTTTNTPLGGENYAAASVEYVHDIGQVGNVGLRGHIFADAGAVWGLAETDLTPSGTVDDALHWRTSAGIGLSAVTQIGVVEVFAAKPLLQQTYDETQTFSIAVRLDF